MKTSTASAGLVAAFATLAFQAVVQAGTFGGIACKPVTPADKFERNSGSIQNTTGTAANFVCPIPKEGDQAIAHVVLYVNFWGQAGSCQAITRNIDTNQTFPGTLLTVTPVNNHAFVFNYSNATVPSNQDLQLSIYCTLPPLGQILNGVTY